MNRAMVLLETGENSELAPAALPGKGTSTAGVWDAFSGFDPAPWFTA